VVVQDQNLQPVSNANCTATVNWSNDSKDVISITTNSNGVGIIPLSFEGQSPGDLIKTDVACTYNTMKSGTKTSFRIWY
jgi:hypothetical protein